MMLADFLHFISKQGLCTEKDRILIAVSGGVDSMVLQDLFYRAGFEIGIVHCNFRLRGKEADRDEFLVKQTATELGIPFFLQRFETEKYSKDQRLSIQMAARELRYEWFEKLRKEQKYDYIATAHHLNDQIETVLYNLIRGTGLQGLTGIPVRYGNVIRPLLFARKKSIADYAEERKISFREDRSNLEVKYRRNLIRNRIMPLIEEINPGFISTMSTTLERLGDSQQLIGYWLKRSRSEYLKKEGEHIYFNKAFFHQVNSIVFLHEILKEWGFQFDQCRTILEKPTGATGAVFFSATHVLNVDREYLILSPRGGGTDYIHEWTEDRAEIETRFGLFKKEIVSKGEAEFSADPHVEFFDHSTLKFPLTIRTWQEGDWFMPLGMKGKKKLSDFMIDEKIPVNLKQRLSVLLSEGAIVWVVGYRMDERFKVIPESNQLLKIVFKPSHDQSI